METSEYRWAAQAAHLISNSPALVAIVGGGGKTTLLYALGNYLHKLGKRVLLSTTTRMFPPREGEAVMWLGQDNPPPQNKNGLYLWGAGMDQAGKVIGLKHNSFLTLMDQYDYILVEADGSRGLPLKFWGVGEPVLPQGVTDVLCLASLRALDQPVAEVLHRLDLCKEKMELPAVVDADLFNALRLYQYNFLKAMVPGETRITLIDRDPGNLSDVITSPYPAVCWKQQQITVRFVAHQIAVIVLAGGAGSRFGGGKLTANLAGKPVLSWVLRKINSTSLYPRVVVSGDNEGVRELAESFGFHCVKNDQWATGMSSSLKKGLSWINSSCAEGKIQGVLIMLGDMPIIQRKTIQQILATLERQNPQVAYPVFQRRRGHPVYFSKECFPALLTVKGDSAGRSIIDQFKHVAIKTDDQGILLDIDFRNDLAKMEQHIKLIFSGDTRSVGSASDL